MWHSVMDAQVLLKVVSAIAGPNIKDHIHPHDPLAARPISRPSKKTRLCSLGSEICTQKHLLSTSVHHPLKSKTKCSNQ